MFVSIWNAQLSESEIKYYLSIYLCIETILLYGATLRPKLKTVKVGLKPTHITATFGAFADRDCTIWITASSLPRSLSLSLSVVHDTAAVAEWLARRTP